MCRNSIMSVQNIPGLTSAGNGRIWLVAIVAALVCAAHLGKRRRGKGKGRRRRGGTNIGPSCMTLLAVMALSTFALLGTGLATGNENLTGGAEVLGVCTAVLGLIVFLAFNG